MADFDYILPFHCTGIDKESTVNPNTLWSYFHADISVAACSMPIKLQKLTWYVKSEVMMQFFNYKLNTEVLVLIRPTILEIFAWNWLHRRK